MNTTNLIGRLTKEPDMKYTPNGKAVTRFVLAVNRPFTNQDGDREADFIPCIAWGKLAENIANFVTKGSLVGIVGRIQTGSYDNEEGKKVYTTDIIVNEVEFLEKKKS